MDSTPHTQKLSKPHAALVVLGFLALTVGASAFDALSWLLHGPSGNQPQIKVPVTAEAVLYGGAPHALAASHAPSTAHALERNLENGSAFGAAARPRWNELRYRALGDSGGRIVAGRDGWLFLAGDARPPRDTPRLQAEFAARVAAIALALRARGVGCLVVLVPDKIALYADKLPRGFSPPEPRYQALRAELTTRGIDAPDLLGWMQSGPDIDWYRRDDTHWSLAGVEHVAELLAPHVRARAGECGPRADWYSQRDDWRPGPWHRGDLLSIMNLRIGSALWDSLRERESWPQVQVRRSEQHKQLFMAGTSMGYKQLREQLVRGLGVEIESWVQAGSGASGKISELITDIAAGRHPEAKLVLWENVERYSRESPAMTFEPLPALLSTAWADAWRPLLELAPAEARERELSSLARKPVEGEALPRRTDMWRVRSWGQGLVLPGDGTCSIVFELPGAGDARAIGARQLPARGWTDAHVQHLDLDRARLVLLDTGWIDRLDLALPAELGDIEPQHVRIESAWQLERELEAPTWSRGAHGWDLELDLGAELLLDETRALCFELAAGAGSNTFSLALDTAAAAPEQLLPLPDGGRALYLVPLRAGTDSRGWSTASRSRLRVRSGSEAPRLEDLRLMKLPGR